MLTDLLMLVPQMIRRSADSDEAREQAAFGAWLIAVGGPIRRVTAPIRLERKTLILAVPDSTWRTQLAGMKGQIIFKLNSLLGAALVTNIEYVVNPALIVRQPEVSREVKFTAPEKQALPLREQADRIADPQLRATFLRAAGKCLERTAK